MWGGGEHKAHVSSEAWNYLDTETTVTSGLKQ